MCEEKQGCGEAGGWGRFCQEISAPGLYGALDRSHSISSMTWNGAGNLSSFLEEGPSSSCLVHENTDMKNRTHFVADVQCICACHNVHTHMYMYMYMYMYSTCIYMYL